MVLECATYTFANNFKKHRPSQSKHNSLRKHDYKHNLQHEITEFHVASHIYQVAGMHQSNPIDGRSHKQDHDKSNMNKTKT